MVEVADKPSLTCYSEPFRDLDAEEFGEIMR